MQEIEGTSYEDYTSVDITAKVMEITGGAGCKAVIDGIGKSTVDISIDCLSRRGIFVSFGNASGAVPPFPVLRLIKKSAFVTRPKLLDYVADRKELLARSEEVETFAYRYVSLRAVTCRHLKSFAVNCRHLPSPTVPFRDVPSRLVVLLPATCRDTRLQVFGWLKTGELSVGIDKVFPLSEAVDGHKYLEAGKSKGKLIYKI